MDADAEPVHMEQRERKHQTIFGLPLPRNRQCHCTGQEIAVRQECPFGLARSTRRENEERGIISAQIIGAPTFCGELLVLREQHNLLESEHVYRATGKPRRVVEDDNLRGRFRRDVGELGIGERGVHRYHDQSCGECAEVNNDQRNSGKARHHDTIANAQTTILEVRSDPHRSVVKFSCGHPLLSELGEDRVARIRAHVGLPRGEHGLVSRQFVGSSLEPVYPPRVAG